MKLRHKLLLHCPLDILVFLPKSCKDLYLDLVWDNKTDSQIVDSFIDATDWIDISLGKYWLVSVAEDCIKRLDTRILPQMRARGLL